VIETRGDGQIVAGLLDRDPRALDAAWNQYHRAVVFSARRILRDWSAAEDVGQEVFCALWERPDRVDLSRGTLRVFLTKSAHFRALDVVRSEHARGRREERVTVSQVPLAADLVEVTVIDVDTNRRRAGAVRYALDGLPKTQQKAIELAYFAGHSYREVGAILSIPEGTAKSRLRAGLAALGRSLPTALASSNGGGPGTRMPVGL
jgi:RNA polymerase sigma-70 factor (ECF subfamily)